MADLTAEQRANLDKLATYLEGLPKRYRHFGMALYADGLTNEAGYAAENGGVAAQGCGAVACAVGHGPAAGVLVPARYIRGPFVRWYDYSYALFTNHDFYLWSWLFDGDWQPVDNHHHGAAARIRFVLDGNSVPEGFDGYPKRKHRALYAPYRIDAKQPA